MRRLFIGTICILTLLALSNDSLQFEPTNSDGGGGGRNTTTAFVRSAVTAFVPYNETRPVAPNGYLCVFGAKGRLNNLILQNLVGIHMAHHLNRTLLVDPEVSTYYDIDRLSLTAYPESPHAAAMPIERSPHKTCGDPRRTSPYTINHGRNIRERFDDYDRQTREKKLVSVDNGDVWYWLGRPPEEVYGRFFRGLVPRRTYLDKVNTFLNENQAMQESPTFNAAHLRYFEGRCGTVDTDLCCPKMQHVQELLIERGGKIMDPLFIANDGQCPPEVLRSYANATDPVVMGYKGPCEGTECAVLDFEVCVRAEVFVGNLKSSGDMNIREWRLSRFGKAGSTSVLSQTAEAAGVEGRTTHMTRYIMGHWRFRPDCDAIRPAQRASKPCV